MWCVCGHKLVEHDEFGMCRPMVMIDASQGMGVLVAGRCTYECCRPRVWVARRSLLGVAVLQAGVSVRR